MERPLIYAAAALVALSTIAPAIAKGEPPNNAAAAQAMAAEAARQNAERGQQVQVQAQQNQQRQAQMQQMEKEQAQARSNQEQAVKAQEEQARGAQMNAIKMQQAEAKQAQEQMRQQAQMQKGQQEQQRNQAAQMQKVQEQQRDQAAQVQKVQEQQRNQAAQVQKEQQEQQRNQAAQMQKVQEQQRNQTAEMQRNQAAQQKEQEQHNRQPNQVVGNMNERMPGNQRTPEGAAQQAEQRGEHQEHGGQQIAAQGQHMNPGASFVRAAKPRAITANIVPTAKAVSMPVLEPGATAQEQQHAAAATKNLQRHLIAVPGNQAPQNGSGIRNSTVNNYFNNYRATVNNRQISINRQNTNFNMIPPTQFPHWWQSDPGWTYSNGFTLGSLASGSDWLGWGWHPYWGPPPEGFVCESDYVPTPWFYIPSAGLWRQPGVMGYADYGPPYDYEGPITVEVMEPRHIQVRDPFTGWTNDRVVNVVYFYNAYYYPDNERYGYMNRHGYFIWLNFDDSDGDSND